MGAASVPTAASSGAAVESLVSADENQVEGGRAKRDACVRTETRDIQLYMPVDWIIVNAS